MDLQSSVSQSRFVDTRILVFSCSLEDKVKGILNNVQDQNALSELGELIL